MPAREWISAREGARLLDIHFSKFSLIARAAGIRQQRLPGMARVRYSASDCLKIARESVLGSPSMEEPQAASC